MSKHRLRYTLTFVLAMTVLVGAPTPALAYAGPGGVITGVGALVALGAALFAAVFGFLWFPLKRLARWLHRLRVGDDADADTGAAKARGG